MKKIVSKTVQFWRIVDRKSGDPYPKDIDWHVIVGGLTTKYTTTIDGRDVTGRAYNFSRDAINELKNNCPIPNNPGLSPNGVMGLVIAAEKDHIPNQQDGRSGQQAPVQMNTGWDAVDNSFIWHLPFGNMFAYVAESQSSIQPNKYAAWLTKYWRNKTPQGKPVDFMAVPVLDEDVINKMKKAKGLRSLVLRTRVGKHSIAKNPVATMFSKHDSYTNVQIETKISFGHAKGSEADEKKILDVLNDNLGYLSEFSKLQANVIDVGGNTTEIDLLKQRVTRKRDITFSNPSANAITMEPNSVFMALAEAFNKDAKLLDKLKNSGR
nr:MAG TPA: hypothetical protein [Caudoviricetes sp.]